ncbi:hypothetical protein BDD12DRAFT_889782 [Trichophaea hybrida]|nr:hypothetical protein BDD12DRAFT_889782 [Trichophaea hybrida]
MISRPKISVEDLPADPIPSNDEDNAKTIRKQSSRPKKSPKTTASGSCRASKTDAFESSRASKPDETSDSPSLFSDCKAQHTSEALKTTASKSSRSSKVVETGTSPSSFESCKAQQQKMSRNTGDRIACFFQDSITTKPVADPEIWRLNIDDLPPSSDREDDEETDEEIGEEIYEDSDEEIDVKTKESSQTPSSKNSYIVVGIALLGAQQASEARETIISDSS